MYMYHVNIGDGRGIKMRAFEHEFRVSPSLMCHYFLALVLLPSPPKHSRLSLVLFRLFIVYLPPSLSLWC